MTATESATILAQPVMLPCGAVLPNRIAKAAMTEGLSQGDNVVSERQVELYRRWGNAGAGVLITGNVLVDRNHLERGGNVAIEGSQSNLALSRLADMASAAKAHGSHLWMQLNHAGRQTQKMINKRPSAPSDIGLKMGNGRFGTPEPMSAEEIRATIAAFVDAAQVAESTGFDGVQVHAAHGYLCSQFLSPLSNTRTDEWGGSLENRARFLLDIVRGVRAVTRPGFAVTVKLNSADFQKGGFSQDDSVTVSRWLQEAGIDLIEVSGGNYEQPRMIDFDRKDVLTDEAGVERKRASTVAREAYFLDFVPLLRASVDVPVMVTGGFRTVAAMARAVSQDSVDMVGIGRPFCTDPDIAHRILDGSVTRLRDVSNDIRIGKGLLGPASPISFLRDLNAWGELGWYYEQIYRLADGKNPDFELSGLKALLAYDKTEGRAAKALLR